MKRNFSAPLLDLDGKPFADGATLKSVTFTVLASNLQGDDRMTGEAKLQCYALMVRLHAGGLQDISAEEITLLKSRGAQCLSIPAFGIFCQLLEQDLPAPPVQYDVVAAEEQVTSALD